MLDFATGSAFIRPSPVLGKPVAFLSYEQLQSQAPTQVSLLFPFDREARSNVENYVRVLIP